MLEGKILYLLRFICGLDVEKKILPYVMEDSESLSDLKEMLKSNTKTHKFQDSTVTHIEYAFFVKLRELPAQTLIDVFSITTEDMEKAMDSERQSLITEAKIRLEKDYICRYEGTSLFLGVNFWSEKLGYKKTAKGMLALLPTLSNLTLRKIIEVLDSEDLRAIEREDFIF